MIHIYKPDGTSLLSIDVDDDSYRFREIMGSNELVLKFNLPSYTEIPVGSYCVYPEQAGGERYVLITPSSVVINHRHNFEYSVTFEGAQGYLRKHKLYNTVDGRLKFDYTAQPQEHLQLIVDNMCDRYGLGTWEIGGSPTSIEKLISYNHNNLLEALDAIASAFETEWEIYTEDDVNYIVLGKVEKHADNPLPLSYGKGNGFISGVSRTNYDDNLPIGRLYMQGGERNIDYSKYPTTDPESPHSNTLLLPRSLHFSFDGEYFSDEYGYSTEKGVAMSTDIRGYSVSLASASDDVIEDSLSLEEVYPSREGEVTEVLFWDTKLREYVDKEDITDWDDIQIDIVDETIPDTLDYAALLMDGENAMTMIFQGGMLVARELEVAYYHTSFGGKPAKRFEIIKEAFDGQMMPSEYFLPDVGDKYAVFEIMLPQEYFAAKTADTEHAGKYIYSGAEYKALRQAAQYLYKNRNAKYTFKGVLDGIYAKRNWSNIADNIVIGGKIRFTDASVVGEDVHYDLRIASVKESINNPHSPTIELTDEEVYSTSGLASSLRKLKGDEVHAASEHRAAIDYAKRGFRDAKETSSMLEAAFAGAWGSSVNPVTVQTMQLLAGDEQLQIKFWEEAECVNVISTPVAENVGAARLECLDAYIQHLTWDVADSDVLTTARPYTSYHRWHISGKNFLFSALEPELAYYLYASCTPEAAGSRTTVNEATYEVRPTPAPAGIVDGKVWYLIGILNSERDGTRGYSSVYGYTEILPNQITTSLIKNANGDSYFDLEGNKFKLGDKLLFNTTGHANELVLNGAMVQMGDDRTVTLLESGASVLYQGEWNVNPRTGQTVIGGIVYYGNEKRRDVVKYNGVWYAAKVGIGAIPKMTLPTNTSYWEQWGASFESVATGLLLAQQATIDNLIVRMLKTADTGARVQTEGVNLEMLDSGDNRRLLLTGDDINIMSVNQTFYLPTQPVFSEGYTRAEIESGVDLRRSKIFIITNAETQESSMYINVGVIEVDQPSVTLTPPAIPLAFKIGANSISSGSCTYAALFWYQIDGEDVSSNYLFNGDLNNMRPNNGMNGEAASLSCGSQTLSSGKHTIGIRYILTVQSSGIILGSSFAASANISLTGNFNVSYSAQCTALAANGLRVMFSGSQYASFLIDENHNAVLQLVNNNYGIRIESNRTLMRFPIANVPKWFECSLVSGSGDSYSLKLTPLT